MGISSLSGGNNTSSSSGGGGIVDYTPFVYAGNAPSSVRQANTTYTDIVSVTGKGFITKAIHWLYVSSSSSSPYYYERYRIVVDGNVTYYGKVYIGLLFGVTAEETFKPFAYTSYNSSQSWYGYAGYVGTKMLNNTDAANGYPTPLLRTAYTNYPQSTDGTANPSHSSDSRDTFCRIALPIKFNTSFKLQVENHSLAFQGTGGVYEVLGGYLT